MPKEKLYFYIFVKKFKKFKRNYSNMEIVKAKVFPYKN